LNVLLLPGLGTIIHGEGKRGLIQILTPIVVAILILMIGLIISFVLRLYLFGWFFVFIVILFILGFLVWIWALLDEVAFVQNREEFYIFKNLK